MKTLFKFIICTILLININVKAANETAITNVKVNDEPINCENLKCNATVDSDKAVIKFTLIDVDATSSGFNSGDTFTIEGDTLVKKLTVSKKMEGLDTPLSSEYTFTITGAPETNYTLDADVTINIGDNLNNELVFKLDDVIVPAVEDNA